MKIYFMGICGTAMGNVAVLCKQQGYEVVGSDKAAYPPMSNVLRDSAIVLYEGYDEKRLQEINPDLVVVGNAIPRGNPEVEYLLDSRALKYTSLPDFLNEFILKNRDNVVITGTHGKTTTSALTAYIIKNNQKAPGYLIGGVPFDFPSGSSLGKSSDPFVIEGDEYDSAFFDKRSKFIHYSPKVLTINNIEFDHADIFRDLEDVKRTFRHLLRIVPRSGTVVINGDDSNIESLMPVPWTNILRVGVGECNDLRIVNFKESFEGSQFDLYWQGGFYQTVTWKQHGLFNARNAASALLAAKQVLGLEDINDLCIKALADFKGVKRRQEVLHHCENLTVFEDFAHHPTAIEEAVRSFRNRFPQHRISIYFEPRCNTMQKNVFQGRLVDAFKGADLVCFGPVFEKKSFESEQKLDMAKLCSDMKKKHSIAAEPFKNNQDLLTFALNDFQENKSKQPQVICFLTNGSFDGIINEFVQRAIN